MTEILREIEPNTIFTNNPNELIRIMQHCGQLVFSRVNYPQVNFDQVIPHFFAKLNLVSNEFFNIIRETGFGLVIDIGSRDREVKN